MRHVLAGQTLIGGSLMASGAALDWLRRLLPGNLSYDEVTALAAQSEAGAGGVIFLPYLNGELQPINDGQARGVFFGMNFSTTSAEIARAVLEGVAFAIAHNLQLAREMGIGIDAIRAVGRPAHNALWCQIIADITQRPLDVLPGSGGAPLGDALLAGAGVGLVDFVGMTFTLGEAQRYWPNPAHRARYEALFAVYRSLYPALRQPFAALVGSL
jgi:xylulokinase